MTLLTLFILLAAALGALAADWNADDWERLDDTTFRHKRHGGLYQPEAGEYYQGDMRFPDEEQEHLTKRNIPYYLTKWPGGVLPYSFAPPHDQDAWFKNAIREAMDYIEARTCLRFVPWTNQRNRLEFVRIKGCSSYVGVISQWEKQNVDLHGTCPTSIGVIMHELLHAIGFSHEHERSDRGPYISVNVSHVVEEYQRWLRVSDMKLIGTYDVDSIMHYGPYAFALDYSRKVITQLRELQHPIGQRTHLSTKDVQEINDLYNCGSIVQPSTTPPVCVDNNQSCAYWARIGECNNNPGYMLSECKKSCRQCY